MTEAVPLEKAQHQEGHPGRIGGGPPEGHCSAQEHDEHRDRSQRVRKEQVRDEGGDEPRAHVEPRAGEVSDAEPAQGGLEDQRAGGVGEAADVASVEGVGPHRGGIPHGRAGRRERGVVGVDTVRPELDREIVQGRGVRPLRGVLVDVEPAVPERHRCQDGRAGVGVPARGDLGHQPRERHPRDADAHPQEAQPREGRAAIPVRAHLDEVVDGDEPDHAPQHALEQGVEMANLLVAHSVIVVRSEGDSTSR